jgi:uncharacterized protein YdbL (DUF1318 family)
MTRTRAIHQWLLARRMWLMAFAALAGVGAGCVVRTEHTINAHITVDIRHIEEQADDVLDFVEGKTDALPKTAAPETKPSSHLENFMRLLDPMPSARAAELTTLSPLAEEILKRMQGRNGAVAEFKGAGCFGENNRGYLELRDCDKAKEGEPRNQAQQLLAEDNKDRKALYNEIARLNKDANVSVSAVEAIYAQKRLMRAKSGEIYQLPPAGEDFEEFKASAKGKALGDKCQAGAWVSIP